MNSFIFYIFTRGSESDSLFVVFEDISCIWWLCMHTKKYQEYKKQISASIIQYFWFIDN